MTALLDTPVEVRLNGTADDKALTIRAVYKQVLGNPHIMESEHLVSAESQFCNGSLSLREFVRAVAKSKFYRDRYFETCAPYRFVELNFKHLLGRAPLDQAELSEDIRRCIEEGYDAEIDSYVDSVEYSEKFGENIVPFYTAATSQVGQKQVNYNRTLTLLKGVAGVDSATKQSRLVDSVATNSATAAKSPSTSGRISPQDATAKRFKIVVKGVKFDSPRRVSTSEYIVLSKRMSPQIQRIQRRGKIVSISELT
ncbi:MAG TPA: phycobilisome rod-core linker polypeptide [Coleofasciculaceae cyanobacterium]|jgi:phycoerythrin-associated linker protein